TVCANPTWILPVQLTFAQEAGRTVDSQSGSLVSSSIRQRCGLSTPSPRIKMVSQSQQINFFHLIPRCIESQVSTEMSCRHKSGTVYSLRGANSYCQR